MNFSPHQQQTLHKLDTMNIQKTIAAACLCLSAASTWAIIPADLNPVIVEAPFSFRERLFDLSSAVAKAKAENKRLFIYLGAQDCPPCLEFSRFLENHETELKPVFADLVVVDIRTWLRGGSLRFKIDDARYSFAELKALVGDQNSTLYYPYYWLLTPELTQVRQLSRRPSDYTSVDTLKKLLTTTGS